MGFNKVKQFISRTETKVTLGATMIAMSIPCVAFAAPEQTVSVSESMRAAMQTVVSDTLAGITAIAPIGVTIFGAMFAWKKGLQFFKKLS